MSCLVFNFHKGHNVTVATHQGKAAIICLDCQVLADLEAVSGHITPQDACIVGTVPNVHVSKITQDYKSGQCRVVLNQISPGVSL